MVDRSNSFTMLSQRPFDTAVTFAMPQLAPNYYFQQCLAQSAGLERAIQQIREFEHLQVGWDGEEAVRISKEAAGRTTRAIYTLACQMPVPDVTPNSNGTLTLEWVTKAGHANIEIGTTRFAGYVDALGGPTGYFGGTNEDVSAYVGSLLHALLYKSTEQTDPVTNVEVVDGR